MGRSGTCLDIFWEYFCEGGEEWPVCEAIQHAHRKLYGRAAAEESEALSTRPSWTRRREVFGF
jgi:hypothetical protein